MNVFLPKHGGRSSIDQHQWYPSRYEPSPDHGGTRGQQAPWLGNSVNEENVYHHFDNGEDAYANWDDENSLTGLENRMTRGIRTSEDRSWWSEPYESSPFENVHEIEDGDLQRNIRLTSSIMHQPADDRDLPAISGISLNPREMPKDAKNPGFVVEVGKKQVSSSPRKASAGEDGGKEAVKAKTIDGMRTAWTKKWVSTRKKGANASTPSSSAETEDLQVCAKPLFIMPSPTEAKMGILRRLLRSADVTEALARSELLDAVIVEAKKDELKEFCWNCGAHGSFE